jgi:hypothetical protein
VTSQTAGIAVDENGVFVFGTYKMNERDELELVGDALRYFPVDKGQRARLAMQVLGLKLAPPD